MSGSRINCDRNLVNLLKLAGLSLILISFPLWAQIRTESYQGQEVVANEALVRFKSTLATPVASVIAQIRLAEDIDAVVRIGAGNVLKFHSRSKNVVTLVRELSARPEVAYAEPDFVVYALAEPNDPYFNYLWGLKNTGKCSSKHGQSMG